MLLTVLALFLVSPSFCREASGSLVAEFFYIIPGSLCLSIIRCWTDSVHPVWVAAAHRTSQRFVIGRSLVEFPWSSCRSVLGWDTEPQTTPDVLVGTLHAISVWMHVWITVSSFGLKCLLIALKCKCLWLWYQFLNDTHMVSPISGHKQVFFLHASRQPVTSTIRSWHIKQATCLLAHWLWGD